MPLDDTLKPSARYDVDGQLALITGASSGLGEYLAECLAEQGCNLILAARRLDRLEELLARVRAQGVSATIVGMDVTDPQSVSEALRKGQEAEGAPNILINNAGVADPVRALDVSEAQWSRIVGTNLEGAWRVATQTAKAMASAGRGGSVVNISSILGLRVGMGNLPYATAKAGLLHMTKAMALELARYEIRVNALAPGYFATDMNSAFFETPAGQDMIRRIPMRRLVALRELSDPVLFLASPASSALTGAVIPVDCGHLISSL